MDSTQLCTRVFYYANREILVIILNALRNILMSLKTLKRNFIGTDYKKNKTHRDKKLLIKFENISFSILF